MDESRKQFELKIQHSYGEDYLVVNDDGDYANWITADLWEFWISSRTAVEIELPESIIGDNGDGEPWRWMYASEVEEAIRAAGIKVKE